MTMQEVVTTALLALLIILYFWHELPDLLLTLSGGETEAYWWNLYLTGNEVERELAECVLYEFFFNKETFM